MAATGVGSAQRPSLSPSNWTARSLVRPAVIIALLLAVLFAIPALVSLYYVDAGTQVAVYAIVALGLNLLVGRVGLVSLGQAAVLAMGAWVAARLLFATSLPFEVVLLISGLITMVLGSLIGLPALRLSGMYLALITLMLAGAITVALATINFPNGGHGFSGYNGGLLHLPAIRRPGIAQTDTGFYRYSVIFAALAFLLVLAHVRSRPGRAWAAIRQSESAALAAGINTTMYKMWAFALASFITGVAGALLAGADRFLYSIDFTTQDSITILAVVLMGGIFSLWGAILAALLMQLLPALLNSWGVSSDWLLILFGVGVLQVLTTAPAGLIDQVPKDLARLGRFLRRMAGGGSSSAKAPADSSSDATGTASERDRETATVAAEGEGSGGRPMIEVSDLTVKFGGVTPIDGMSVKFETGTCGLIGPNGAGKTTFFNVLSGFVKPTAGGVTAFGEDLLKMAHFRRARWGVRRTFQTEQAIEELSVYDNVALAHEHSKESAGSRSEDVLGAISFVGIEVDPGSRVGTLGARDRRLIEVARAVVGHPRVILLDEPAAGLPDEETAHLGNVIGRIPEHSDAVVILVDHDMSLVSSCCSVTSVLDFGKLIASGQTAEVLRDENVVRAYLGNAEVE